MPKRWDSQTSFQVFNEYDNQLLRAIELLPKAKQLAIEFAKNHLTAKNVATTKINAAASKLNRFPKESNLIEGFSTTRILAQNICEGNGKSQVEGQANEFLPLDLPFSFQLSSLLAYLLYSE